MFKKIEISNIGRFKSAKTDGDNEFLKKNTFIYGKNTFGKSTLTAIFRSLKENKPDYIVGRQTIGTQPGRPSNCTGQFSKYDAYLVTRQQTDPC